jgi:hypothetical protein
VPNVNPIRHAQRRMDISRVDSPSRRKQCVKRFKVAET